MATEKRLMDDNTKFIKEDFYKRLIRLDDALRVITPEGATSLHDDQLVILLTARKKLKSVPIVDAVEVEKYKALVEMYHELRENFIDYVCSGTCNVAPYCLNRCEGCVDRVGWCSQGSDECHGFNPAEVILDGAKMDGDGNG